MITTSYDDLNRLTQVTYEDAETVTLTLDANGNATTIVDQNGTEIDQAFDALDRLAARDITLATGVGGDTEEDYAYDALGRLTEAQDDDSTVQLAYDSLSRIVSETQGANPLSTEAMTVTNTWDAEANRTRIEYPSGFEARRTYSMACCLLDIDDQNDDPIVSYTPIGRHHRRWSTEFANGATSEFSYDGFRRTTDISHSDSYSSEFAGFEYAWDANSNPLYEARRHQSGAGDVYTYDQANRLTDALIDVADPAAELASPGTETYSEAREYNMDDVLNLTSYVVTPYGGSASTTSFTSNSMNEYTAVGGTTHTYDDNGNLTDDGVNTYQFDAHNHLLKVTRKSDSAVLGEYRYDALGRGRRTKKIVGSDTTRFVYSGQSVIEEYDGSDDLQRLFVHSDKIDDVAMMEAPDVADVDGDSNTTELKRFYFHDQLIGSVTHITDPDEAVVESYEYGPYGETEIFDINSSSVSVSQIGNPFMYTGRRLDEESGLYYYRARHYSSELKRFIQRDPAGYVDGPNLLAYVCGAVTRAVDPLGLMSLKDLVKTAEDLLSRAAGRDGAGKLNRKRKIVKDREKEGFELRVYGGKSKPPDKGSTTERTSGPYTSATIIIGTDNTSPWTGRDSGGDPVQESTECCSLAELNKLAEMASTFLHELQHVGRAGAAPDAPGGADSFGESGSNSDVDHAKIDDAVARALADMASVAGDEFCPKKCGCDDTGMALMRAAYRALARAQKHWSDAGGTPGQYENAVGADSADYVKSSGVSTGE